MPATLAQVRDFIQQQSISVEVLVVENGSRDRTLEISQEFAAQTPGFRAIHEVLRGKGLAVKRGMLEACGEYRMMCDADLSMPVTEIPRFFPPKLEGYDVVIASREAPGSRRIGEPFYRHLGGRVINWIIRIMALPGLNDTQCGFKCFSSRAAEVLFSQQTLAGWSFDIEILYLARRGGYKIKELPIPWFFDPESKLSILKDTFRMVVDILSIRRNDRRGFYKGLNAKT